ncbi:MAG TPA: hypothetical protein PKI32_07955 [Opitutales bacterium]|mgnify:CR=1 FL=1|nr:hypothetical protein [Opitutales bacterium]
MDPVAIAAYLVQSQSLVDSSNVGAALLRKEHAMQNELVNAITEQPGAQASQPPEGTGQYLNIIA